jgi:hypothetical protein
MKIVLERDLILAPSSPDLSSFFHTSSPRHLRPGINAGAMNSAPEGDLKPDSSGVVYSPGIYARAEVPALIPRPVHDDAPRGVWATGKTVPTCHDVLRGVRVVPAMSPPRRRPTGFPAGRLGIGDNDPDGR